MLDAQRHSGPRLLGVGLYAIAVGLIVLQSFRYSARFDEVDAASGYLVPFDFVLVGATVACVVVAWLIHRRLD